jgi:aspartyl-tRNA(Asn)/glutamyl-tRNA(Gln) amidotransferase subunit B
MVRLKILLADDHETVREGLKAILNAQDDMHVVGEAADGEVAVTRARELLPDVVGSGKSPGTLVQERGLAQVSDTSAIETAARQAIEANPTAVADYKAGKTTAINFLKGQLMKATRGQANPAVAEEVLKTLLA